MKHSLKGKKKFEKAWEREGKKIRKGLSPLAPPLAGDSQ